MRCDAMRMPSMMFKCLNAIDDIFIAIDDMFNANDDMFNAIDDMFKCDR